MLGQVALAAVAYAQGTVHEEFELAVHCLPDALQRLQRSLPLHYQPRVSEALLEPGVFRRTDGALRGRMQRHLDVVPLRDGGVLDYEGVHARLLRLKHEPVRSLQLAVK